MVNLGGSISAVKQLMGRKVLEREATPGRFGFGHVCAAR